MGGQAHETSRTERQVQVHVEPNKAARGSKVRSETVGGRQYGKETKVGLGHVVGVVRDASVHGDDNLHADVTAGRHT